MRRFFAIAPSKEFVENLASKVLSGDRAALGKAITLSESSRSDHREMAQELLAKLLPHRPKKVLRIGISGPPGAGKSTFIEAIGEYVTKHTQRKISVLAIDPSSVISGGSILGDKTRMNELSRNSNVFIRATPSRGILGGVAQHTNEAILMCEAAGYDISIIETVGVGQSEIAVAEICDLVLLLVPPAGGDELQGIKKGIIEIADMVIINKADGDLVEVAKRAKAEYLRGLQLVRPRMPEVWKPKVLTCSSANLNGIDHVWEQIQLFEKNTGNFGILDDRRRKQRKKWLWREVREQLVQILNEDKENNASLQDQILKSEEAVDLDTSTPRSAASKIIHAFLKVDFEKRLPNSN